MAWDEVLKWALGALALINFVVGVFHWVMRKEFATKEDLGKVKASIDAVTDRVTIVENELEHVPSKEDISRLLESVAYIKGGFERWGKSIDRIEEFLLNRSGS